MTAPEPGYERIAGAIITALDAADYRIVVQTGTGSDWGTVPGSYEQQVLRVARVLDKAGLIDWAAFQTEHVVTQHWDHERVDVVFCTCSCGERWGTDVERCPADEEER